MRPRSSAVETVEYALREASDTDAERGASPVVEVHVVVDSADSADVHETRRRIEESLSALEPGRETRWSVDIAPLDGEDPVSRTEALLARVENDRVSRIVLGADNELSVARLRNGFDETRVELAPAAEAPERRRLLHPGGARRFTAIFGLTYLFYLAVGGFAGGPDLVTGAISAGVVALSLSRVAFREEPTLDRTGLRIARTFVFLPVLLWEIVKANFVIAYLILHPRLPIDPSMGTVETATEEGLERMALANSITLTPGTLTVDVRDRAFTIHSLTAGARADVERGRLERLVAWVFHGKRPEEPSDTTGGGA